MGCTSRHQLCIAAVGCTSGGTHSRHISTRTSMANLRSSRIRTRRSVTQGPTAVSGGQAASMHRWAAECWALGSACLPGPGKPPPTHLCPVFPRHDFLIQCARQRPPVVHSMACTCSPNTCKRHPNHSRQCCRTQGCDDALPCDRPLHLTIKHQASSLTHGQQWTGESL